MIVKKITNPHKSASKTARISGLTGYISSPERADGTEKCVYRAGRGFMCGNDAPEAQAMEMLALAEAAVRSRDPINHYVISWREGERPTVAQIEETVTRFLDELDLRGHQAIYGVHADTDNCHLHIAVNRVNPDTLKCVEINGGFDIEAAHSAVAKIEREQGWRGDNHYERGGEKSPQPRQRARDMENRTGEVSAERRAIEQAAPIIKSATSWERLHRELAAAGMRYEKTGSGATVFIGDVGVKASAVDRAASLTKLEKRLGAYQPNTTARAAAPVKSNAPSQYHCEREEFHLAKADAKTALDRRQAQAREELFDRQKKQRGEKWNEWQKELPKRGRGKKINALRSVLAHEQAVERATLRDAHRREREQFKHDFPPFPDFKRWLKKSKNPELADEWRYRHGEQPAQIIGDNYEKPRAEKDIRDFSPRVSGDNVFYARRGENSAAFIDKGKLISIHDESRDAVLAALQLAAQKWGAITITGNEKYLATCVQLAAEHGIKIKNPELQNRLAQARDNLRQQMKRPLPERPQTPKREPSRGWSR